MTTIDKTIIKKKKNLSLNDELLDRLILTHPK
jgi:hypothetical protein